jgi:hypothetical protein
MAEEYVQVMMPIQPFYAAYAAVKQRIRRDRETSPLARFSPESCSNEITNGGVIRVDFRFQAQLDNKVIRQQHALAACM